MTVCEVGTFPADFVERIRIGTAVSVVVDVTEGSGLESVIHRISCGREYTKRPTGLHFFLLFLSECSEAKNCCSDNCKDFFHTLLILELKIV
jgi:hypothetical protein